MRPPREPPPASRARARAIVRIALVLLIAGGIAAVLVVWGGDIWAVLGDRERFRAWIESHGVYAAPVFVAIQVFQVVVFVIPGEITQVAGGYIFGTWAGLALNCAGLVLGSLAAFGLGRLFEHAVVELLVDRERLARFDALVYGRAGVWPMLVLFLIPGIPKDLLCYVAGMTPMPVSTFLAVSTIGRLPGVLLSSLFGGGLAGRDWTTVGITAGVTVVLLVLAYVFRGPVARFRERYLVPPSRRPGAPPGPRSR